jgi:hypothetical protein
MNAEDLIPPAAAILQRIEALQQELKALRRLLRVSRDAERGKATQSPVERASLPAHSTAGREGRL